MKIALFTDGIYPYVIGGMQKHSFYLAKYFALNKIYVDLYHTNQSQFGIHKLEFFTDEEKKFIQSFVIPFPKLDKFPGHYIRESYAYSKRIYSLFLNNSAVDFIYVQGFCGMKLLEKKNNFLMPVGINFHGLEMFQKAPTLKYKLQQNILKKPVVKSMQNADIVFSLGGKLTEIIAKQGIHKEKIVQIPIGIDESWIKKMIPKTNSSRKFIFIGRYERRKGIQELTKTIKQLLPKHRFSFDFIGAIPEKEKIKSDNIFYHGNINDVQKIKKIISAADVLVCPSYSEGMPTVILEAMASGLAIIATDVGAVSEQVNEKNGKLITPGNINELKQAIIEFIDMPEVELLEMKKKSIQRIENSFTWDKIIIKTIERINNITRK